MLHPEGMETIILGSLIHDDVFFASVMPHLKEEYFENRSDQEIYKGIFNFNEKYNKPPTVDSLYLDLENTEMQESTWTECEEILTGLRDRPNVDAVWRLDETEKWCQNRAFFIAFEKGVEIFDSENPKDRLKLPELISESLSVTFDNNIGIEYGKLPEEQWDYYNISESTLPFDLDILNKITKGGLRRKTLFMLMSTKTGGFKSGTMCHFTAAAQAQGQNVLYITCELAENEVIKRIDANLTDIPLDDLKDLPKENYVNRVKTIKKGLTGRCIVKEFPPGTAHAGHFRHLLKELKTKSKFEPDVICIDYLNICASSRYSAGQHSSYVVVKAIAEELRALSFEFDCAIVSATQSGRQGVKAGVSIDVDDISESYGLAATADVILAIIDDEELSNQKKLLMKQIKNRFGDINYIPTFAVGTAKERMKLYDVEVDESPEPDQEEKPEPTWQSITSLEEKKEKVSDWVL